MTGRLAAAAGALFLLSATLFADEPGAVGKRYHEIAADYQLIAGTTSQPAVREAAARLTRDAYRQLVGGVTADATLNDDDRYALGQCHEALGEYDRAAEWYRGSMSAGPTARGHLALARLSAVSDPAAAERDFAAAEQADPQYPGLPQFHLLLGAAYQRERDWDQAIEHLQLYEKYAIALAEQEPNDASRAVRRNATTTRIAHLQTVQSLFNQPAPALSVESVVQGELNGLEGLHGSVVLLDFCAVWSNASRVRMEKLNDFVGSHTGEPLAVVSCVLAVDDGIALGYEADKQNTIRHAARHGYSWPIAYVLKDTVEAYGVSTVPHTVVLDKQGRVRMVLQASDAEGWAEFSDLVTRLLAE